MSLVARPNLPDKFNTFYLGHPNCTDTDLLTEISAAYRAGLTHVKDNAIYKSQGWFFKRRHRSRATPGNYNLYRVRKAQKIAHFLAAYQLSNDIVIPKKYIYWDGTRLHVVAKELPLSNEVAQPTEEFARSMRRRTNEGQAQAFCNGNPTRELTSRQAWGMANLAFLGYTDLCYNNAHFTTDGKVAIVDTEPLRRNIKKGYKKSLFYSLMTDFQVLSIQQGLSGTARLKLYCANPEAKHQIENVERYYAIIGIIKLIGKTLLISSIIYFTPEIAAAFIFPTILSNIVLYTIAGFGVLKNFFSILQIWSLVRMWGHAHNGEQGVVAFNIAESNHEI